LLRMRDAIVDSCGQVRRYSTGLITILRPGNKSRTLSTVWICVREANRRSLHSGRDDNFARIRLKGLSAGCVDANLFSDRATSLRDVSETLGLNANICSSPSQSGIGYQGLARFALSQSRPRLSDGKCAYYWISQGEQANVRSSADNAARRVNSTLANSGHQGFYVPTTLCATCIRGADSRSGQPEAWATNDHRPLSVGASGWCSPGL
jgi:hypothetical protein